MRKLSEKKTFILLLIIFLFCSSCYKKAETKILLDNNIDSSNKTDIIKITESYADIFSPIHITIQNSPSYLQLDYSEDKGQIKDNRALFPIQLKDKTFEYISGADLIRFDLISHQKTIYPDVFDYTWCNRNNKIIFQDNENWILSDEENYYYQDFEYWENEEVYRNSKKLTYLICKDRNNFHQKWKILISDDDNVYAQRIIQNQDSIFVFIRKSLSMKCIDKQTGHLRWHFQTQNTLPWIGFPDEYRHCNAVLSRMKVRLIHQFRDYLVVNFYAFDTRKKIKENPFMEETDEIVFLLSLDGKFIREIDDAMAFTDDLYLYNNSEEYGMKQIIDGKILWSKAFSDDKFNEDWKTTLPDLEEVKPFFLTKSYFVQYVISQDNGQSYTTLRFINYPDGSVAWTKTLPFYLTELKEYKRMIYVLGTDQEYSYETNEPVNILMMIINPFTSSIDSYQIQTISHYEDYYAFEDFKISSIHNHVFLFFEKGFMTITNKQFAFNPNIVLNNAWTIPDYWDFSLYIHNQTILTMYTNDSEESGGGYMVFKVIPFKNYQYHEYE